MTKTEEIICRKMYAAGQDIIMKRSGEKLTIIDSSKEITREQYDKYCKAGIGVLQYKGKKIFYYKDDFELNNGFNFVAKQDIVKSLPVSTEAFEEFEVVGKSFDLTDFIGTVVTSHITGKTIIIGEGVFFRHIKDYGINVNITDLITKPRFDFLGFDFKISSVKLITTKPIQSLHSAFSRNLYITYLDLSEANLTECKDFERLCKDTKNLYTFQCGRIAEDANCKLAFHGSNLYPNYNEKMLKRNAVERLQVLKMDIPRLFPIIDTDLLKVAATNLNVEQLQYLFPGYKCRRTKLSREKDIESLPFAFMYKIIEKDGPNWDRWVNIILQELKNEFAALFYDYEDEILLKNDVDPFRFLEDKYD